MEFDDDYSEESPSTLPDINLTEQDSLYLIRQRIENLREKVGIPFDEILELQELEAIFKPFEDDLDAIPENLGIPGRIDQFIAALEAKRVNRYDDTEYDGGDIDEENESVSSIDQHYQNLLQESWLNIKSIKILSPQKLPLRHNNGRKKDVSLFDVFAQADFHKIFMRCKELAVSPIYDGMKEVKEDHYQLQYGCEIQFTDKTAVLTIPIDQFFDIPQSCLNETIGFLQLSFVLPEYAHEKKRFFRKGGTVTELATYLDRLGVSLSENWQNFFHKLKDSGILRLYREVLELENKDEIRGYFLNIRSGYQNGTKKFSKEQIAQSIIDRLQKENSIIIRRITQFSTWYPEWMRKIEGFIVEEKDGHSVSIPTPLRIAVDDRLSPHIFRHERFFMPSPKIISNNGMTGEAWQALFLEELRQRYRNNPQRFKQYADQFAAQEIQFHCACNNNGTHEKYCPVPVLREVLEKINSNK